MLPDLFGPLPSVWAALRSIVGHPRVSRWLSMYRLGVLHPGYQRLKASGRNLQVSDSNVIMSVSVVNIHVIFMYVRPCCSHRTYGGVFATISSSYVAIFVMVGFKPFSCSCTISFPCLRIRSGKNVQSC